jgi:hypothetical protein
MGSKFEEPSFDSQQRQRIFNFSDASRPAPETHPDFYSMDTVAPSQGKIKWPGRESDRSPLSCIEVKSDWSCISTSPYVFMTCTETTLLLLLLLLFHFTLVKYSSHSKFYPFQSHRILKLRNEVINLKNP